jgi:hypothetical protein
MQMMGMGADKAPEAAPSAGTGAASPRSES